MIREFPDEPKDVLDNLHMLNDIDDILCKYNMQPDITISILKKASLKMPDEKIAEALLMDIRLVKIYSHKFHTMTEAEWRLIKWYTFRWQQNL